MSARRKRRREWKNRRERGKTGVGGGGAGGTGESRDARLAKQEMPARRARPTVRGLNTAGEEEREGPAQVRYE